MGTDNSDLPDELIKALGIELFSHWTDSSFPGSSDLQLVVELLLQGNHVGLGGRRAEHVLLVMLASLLVLKRRQDAVQDILSVCHESLVLCFRFLFLVASPA